MNGLDINKKAIQEFESLFYLQGNLLEQGYCYWLGSLKVVVRVVLKFDIRAATCIHLISNDL